MKVHTALLKTFAAAVLALACMSSAQAARSPVMQDCRADYQKFCASVKLGEGRIAECMKQHEAELSPACAADMKTMSDCGPQIKQICGTAPGAVRECIKAHASELSPACRAALSKQQ